ncbi:class I SAM-dependent methyltransferase [Halococcus hamelinensis]|uniref:Methyltransferase type 11 n=1 Tax=Halococcus hamelinensis 100A6 TaxID=1132509 RepID=M0M1M9_9EURY|nr:class I SAM-dependent methyltransferase [Halococcus hamelinensis]EMA39581.1 methyltransferase type 11 [Halococcus hamelinensis 100A6]
MPPNDSATPFASAETYYADYRPGYGEPAIEYLQGRFDLDGSSRVLDLGCGAGQVAVPVAAHAGSVLGMDPNPEMLREAEARAERAGRENLDWVVGSDAELAGVEGPFDLVTMGRSFHWMDQARTLERVHELTSPGGGVALLTNREWITRGTKEWQDAVYALVGEYLADLPERTGPDRVRRPLGRTRHGVRVRRRRDRDVRVRTRLGRRFGRRLRLLALLLLASHRREREGGVRSGPS